MPEMDGMEATMAIREEEKTSGDHQTVIALTAHAMGTVVGVERSE